METLFHHRRSLSLHLGMSVTRKIFDNVLEYSCFFPCLTWVSSEYCQQSMHTYYERCLCVCVCVRLLLYINMWLMNCCEISCYSVGSQPLWHFLQCTPLKANNREYRRMNPSLNRTSLVLPIEIYLHIISFSLNQMEHSTKLSLSLSFSSFHIFFHYHLHPLKPDW